LDRPIGRAPRRPVDEEGEATTMPREPDDLYDRDPYPRGPYDPGDYDPDNQSYGANQSYGSPTWGRAPAGGWGADDYDAPAHRGSSTDYDRTDYDRTGYDRPGSYGDEPRYDWQPGYASPQYENRPRYEPPWSQGNARTTRRTAQQQGRIRLAVAVAIAVVVITVLVLGFVTPGWFVTRVFDATSVQNGVARILTDDYAVGAVADVRCPSDVRVSTGATFSCDATIDGDPVTVPITVTDGGGGYQVGRPT
jgi:hypothetical protein